MARPDEKLKIELAEKQVKVGTPVVPREFAKKIKLAEAFGEDFAEMEFSYVDLSKEM